MTGRLAGKVVLITSTQPLDLTDERATTAWVDEAAERHGGIDALYANAAATRFAAIEDLTHEDWSFVLRHELDVVFLPVRAAWPTFASHEHPQSCWSVPRPASAAR